MQEVDAYSGQAGISMGTCQVLVQVPVLEVDAILGTRGYCKVLVAFWFQQCNLFQIGKIQ